MPPKAKYTKEMIADCAFDLVRRKGIAALTARALGSELGCSPQPIFSCFESMEEVQNTVMEKAKALYADYVRQGLESETPFKGVGLKYVEFAHREPQLFMFLFMREGVEQTAQGYLPGTDENSPQVLLALQKEYGLSEEQARKIYNHISVYTYGMGVLSLARNPVFSMEEVSEMLSQVFIALIKSNL
ncbi:MAG: TetR/AcrR family transcriptional regulator [Oscillospiraceae bacterium]|nr:TetR/AcrR family transcriptional regulator [Oscillospiraceae bacterium]